MESDLDNKCGRSSCRAVQREGQLGQVPQGGKKAPKAPP